MRNRYSSIISLSIVIVLGIIITLSLTALIFGSRLIHPEKAILGTWKEVSWTYERRDNHMNRKLTEDEKFIEEQVKNEISKNLIIHQSEKWQFAPSSELTLYRENKTPVHLHWRLKGRGHVLKLSYDQNITEYYHIQELTPRRMVLQFENDMHVRGIIKIIFKK